MKISLTEAAFLLQKAHTYVLTCHVHPDGDALGSMLGLFAVMQNQGKQVKMLLEEPVPTEYRFLPGWEQVEMLVTDTSLHADMLIGLDVNDQSRMKEVLRCVQAPVLNIDHHISNTDFATHTLLDTQAAATGQIICQLLKALQWPLDVAIGTCLYTAIATDCGFFRYANTTPDTLQCAAQLVAAGAKPHVISEALERRSLADIHALSHVLPTIELLENGRIAMLSIDREILSTKINTEGFIDYPRSIQEVDVAVLFKEIEEKVIRVSLRSYQTNVNTVASALGGGGHVRAAGCTLYSSLEEAKKTVLAELRREMERPDNE